MHFKIKYIFRVPDIKHFIIKLDFLKKCTNSITVVKDSKKYYVSQVLGKYVLKIDLRNLNYNFSFKNYHKYPLFMDQVLKETFGINMKNEPVKKF